MMKNNIFALAILIICICLYLLIPEIISAQPSFPDDPEQIPIDSGLALLTAAGAGYAIKKLKKKNLENNSLSS